MPAVSLFDNTTLGWEPTDLATDQTVGTRFTPSASGFVNRLRWKRVATGHAPDAPSALGLWRVSSGALLVSASPDDDATAAWQDTVLDPSIPVVSGQSYTVGGYFTSGTRRWQGAWSGAGTPPSPLAFGSPHSLYHNGSGLTNPDNDPGAQAFAVDIVFDTTAEHPGGTGEPTLTGDLASWLVNTSANEHQTDGIPWLLKTELAATKLLVQGALDAFKDVDGNVHSIGDLAKEMTPTLVAIVKLFFNRADTQLTGSTAGGGTAFYSSDSRQVAQTVAEIQDAITANVDIELLRERLTLSPDTEDMDRWQLVGTASGEGDGFVDMQADRYTVQWTDLPSGQPQHNIAGAMWVPRAGWAAPVRGGFVGQRSYLDFLLNDVRWAPYLMHGLLIYAHPGHNWLVGAWVLDRPT